MIINLYGKRTDDVLTLVKSGDSLAINGEVFDFSALGDGDTLPLGSVECDWVLSNTERVNGELIVSLSLPNPWNYSPEQAFPAPLVDVPDGRVEFPQPLPDEDGNYPAPPSLPDVNVPGVIHWDRCITKAMKDVAAAAQLLVTMKADLASRNAAAAAQIARIQDRIDTLGYGIDSGEATAEDEAELAALTISLKAWKAYKFALGKVAVQPTWPTTPVWPVIPAIPVIAADPDSTAPETA